MAKFSEEVCSIILDARSSGMTVEECAGIAGISYRTLYRWLEKGEKAKSGKYHDFYFAYLKANLEFVKYHRDKIGEHKDWHASQYLLQVNEKGKYNLTQEIESKVEAEVKVPFQDLERIVIESGKRSDDEKKKVNE